MPRMEAGPRDGFMRRCLVLLVTSLLLPGCKLVLDAGSNGKITAAAIGSECSGTCEITPEVPFEAQFLAEPQSNYVFAGWAGNGCGFEGYRTNPSCPVVVDELVASFGLTYRLEAHFTREMVTGSAADTDEFAITNFGFGGFYTEEVPPVTCYPTIDFCSPGTQASWLMPHNYGTGDFNADGHQDLVVMPFTNSKYISLQDKPSPVIYMNNGTGGLYRSDDIFANGKSEEMYFGYRIAVEDFNGDGVDDLLVGPFGILSREPDTYMEYFPERIPLYLSGPDGKLHDASENIRGQENGALLPNMGFAHDTATGDIDGDGDIDIYLAEKMLLNDGKGNFTSGYSPANQGAYYGYLMSSLIDDLDGDGIGDLVIFYSENSSGPQTVAYLSDGDAELPQRAGVTLPDGLFGAENTKNNHATSGDIDGDGDVDIVVGQTRAAPYYVGRAVQVLLNDGSGSFTDATDELIGDQTYFTEGQTASQGEGAIRLVDVNGDGTLDIFDRRGVVPRHSESVPSTFGAAIWLNDGAGNFVNVPGSVFPWVETGDLQYPQGGASGFLSNMADSVPIDLDGQHGLDVVSYVTSNSFPDWDYGESTLYTLTSKKVLEYADYAN